MAIRVVQWTTGGVGRPAVRAVLAHPDLELVGCFAWSKEKAGKDVGELCNIPPIGITSTADFDEILALRPDIVLYTPLIWDVEDMVRLLEAGINVISTANFITGHSYGEKDMRRLDEAAKKGGVTLYGTGVNPGQANAVALTLAAACREVQRLSIFESADCTPYASPETWLALGIGSPPDTPGLAETARQRQLVFMDAVEVLAKALRVELDEVRYTPEFGIATKDLHLGYMDIPKGTVCGIRGVWQGIVNGKPFIEIGLLWRLGDAMEPDWQVAEAYVIEVRGVPDINVRYDIVPLPDSDDFSASTANPAVNSIPAVIAAPPGLVTVDELPLITAGSVRPPS